MCSNARWYKNNKTQPEILKLRSCNEQQTCIKTFLFRYGLMWICKLVPMLLEYKALMHYKKWCFLDEPEEWGGTFLWNTTTYTLIYVVSHRRRWKYSLTFKSQTVHELSTHLRFFMFRDLNTCHQQEHMNIVNILEKGRVTKFSLRAPDFIHRNGNVLYSNLSS